MVIAEIQSGHAPANVVVDVVRRLERGEVLLLPTDTVYGLHALSRNEEAVARIRKIKGVEEDRPLTTLFSTVVGIGRFVQLPEGSYRRKVLESWPGPITWVLPAQPMMPKHNLGPDGTIGIRIPNNQFLRSICAALDDLVVSTSANQHGDAPPVSQNDINPAIIEAVDGSVFQTEPLAGRPSEVKRWTPGGPEVLRTRGEERTTPEKINILFVCSGNTCRSPMAAGLLRARVEKLLSGKVGVRSAGLMAANDLRASLQCVEVMREGGVDIHQHLSQPLSEELMQWANVVLVMTRDHLDEASERFPHHASKVYLLSAWPDTEVRGHGEIPDPHGGDLETFRKIATQIENEVQRLLPHLQRIFEER